ncbi:hypothetical protein B10172_05360 [Campylobacter jejuni]|nr:hypothetical protein B10172_05360 [Campylobacter jejuni]
MDDKQKQKSTEARVSKLEEQIKELENRIKQLEQVCTTTTLLFGNSKLPRRNLSLIKT